jgi:hypothetical protein
MPTIGVPLRVNIRGTKEAVSKSIEFRTSVVERINEAILKEKDDVETRMREAVQAHFTSGEGSGRAAQSISLELRPGKRGTSVRLRIGAFREVKYFTELLRESEFKKDPYFIFPSQKKVLRFFWKEAGGIVFSKRVRHPGFGRDVLREQGEAELARLGEVVQLQVADTVTKVFARGSQVR